MGVTGSHDLGRISMNGRIIDGSWAYERIGVGDVAKIIDGCVAGAVEKKCCFAAKNTVAMIIQQPINKAPYEPRRCESEDVIKMIMRCDKTRNFVKKIYKEKKKANTMEIFELGRKHTIF